MTRYYTTEKAYSPTGNNPDKVYAVVAKSGDSGCTFVDIAAQTSGFAPTGIYSYLYTLRKGGYIVSREVAATAREKDDEAVEDLMKPRDHKWKCPSCSRWVKEEISRCCKACKEKRK